MPLATTIIWRFLLMVVADDFDKLYVFIELHSSPRSTQNEPPSGVHSLYADDEGPHPQAESKRTATENGGEPFAGSVGVGLDQLVTGTPAHARDLRLNALFSRRTRRPRAEFERAMRVSCRHC